MYKITTNLYNKFVYTVKSARVISPAQEDLSPPLGSFISPKKAGQTATEADTAAGGPKQYVEGGSQPESVVKQGLITVVVGAHSLVRREVAIRSVYNDISCKNENTNIRSCFTIVFDI